MRIVCITQGTTGIIHASLALATRLEAIGGEVTYLSPYPIEETVVKQGISFRPLPSLDLDPGSKFPELAGRFNALKGYWRSPPADAEGAAEVASRLGMDAFQDILRELDPDLVLIDMELHEHILTSVLLKKPTVLLSQWFSTWQRDGLPSLESTVVPGQGKAGTSGALRRTWTRIRLSRSRYLLRERWAGRVDRRAVLLHFAALVGIALSDLELYQFPQPILYRTLPALSMTARELEFPHRARRELSYAGPMVLESRPVTQRSAETDTRLRQIFEEKKTASRRLIYCSVSTLNAGDVQFLRNLLGAVRDRDDWVLVVALGNKIEASAFASVPPNAHLFSWVPQLEVLAQADCSINHGGVHTIHECLHFRVPMLVYSGKRHDQNGCAARVAYHQIGIMADKDSDGPEAIRGRISRILEGSTYRENIEQLHADTRYYLEPDHLRGVMQSLIEG